MATARSERPATGPSMVARAVFWLLLALVFVATAMLQLDRQARISPSLSRFVPEPFQSHALVHSVSRDVIREADAAFEEATLLVSRRPLPAEHLYLASIAAVQAEKPDTADRAMSLAASRGWRVAVPNLLALQGAVMKEDWDSAIYRLSALLRMNSAPDVQRQGLAYIASQEDGREAIARHAGQDAKFAYFTLRSAIDTVELPLAIDTIQRVRAKGAEFNCRDLAWVSAALLRRGAASDAKELWAERCREISPENMALTSASANLEYEDPFAWRWHKAPGLSRSFRGEELRIRNSDFLKRVFAERILTLAPGRYIVRWADNEEAMVGELRPAEVTLEADCYPRGRKPGLEFMGSEYVLTIPDDCPAQQLKLSIGRGKASIGGFTIAG